MSSLLFPTQPNQQSLFTVPEKAVLFVLPPNVTAPIGDQAHRPMLYNITDEFANKASDVALKAAAGYSGPLLNSLINSQEAYNIVGPASVPVATIRMNAVNELWRFILMINDARMSGTVSAFSPLSTMKAIYYGYFSSEPYNPYNPGTVDSQALLNFTHKTIVQDSQSSGHGPGQHHVQTRVDNSIINGQLMSLFSTDDNLFYIDPIQSFKATSRSDEGNFSMPGSASQSARTGELRAIESQLNQPKHNLRHVAQNVILSLGEVNANISTGLLNTDAIMGHNIASDTMHEVLSRTMEARTPSFAMVGPVEGEIWTMGRLVQEYNPVVDPLFPKGSQTFCGVDQHELTPANHFASLLSAVGPSILSHLGIAEVILEYRTTRELKLRMEDEEYFIHQVMPIYEMTRDEQIRRIDQVITLFKLAAFNYMFDTRGDFEVKMHLNCSDISYIQVNFACDQQLRDALYQHPTMLSGLVSPMVGTAQNAVQNADQINKLVDVMLSDQKDHSIDTTGYDPNRPQFNPYTSY